MPRLSDPLERHPLDLCCAVALALVSAIDLYTAESLSLVAYVQSRYVSLVAPVENGLSAVCAVGVALLLVTWPFVRRDHHRRLILLVVSLQTVGLSLDVFALLASTLFGQHANPIYLLLEAALVHASTVVLFAVWYASIDHHRQVARARDQPVRLALSFAPNTNRYPGYERWLPGFVDYLFVAFSASSSLAPSDALPLAISVKLLMMVQVSFSLVILLVLAARAIGLII
jgi:hypothetical protein